MWVQVQRERGTKNGKMQVKAKNRLRSMGGGSIKYEDWDPSQWFQMGTVLLTSLCRAFQPSLATGGL